MLPTVQHARHTLTLPGEKRKVTFRPFTVKEEELLLIAKESKDKDTIYENMLAVIENCTGEKDVASWASFQFEYVFLQIRAKSVGEQVQLVFTCDCAAEGEKPATTNVTVNLPDVKVNFPEAKDTIEVGDSDNGKIFAKLRWPSVHSSKHLADEDDKSEPFKADKLIIRDMIVSVFDEERVYPLDKVGDDEFIAWFDTLPKSAKDRIREFAFSMPQLEHEVKYKCSKCGADKTHVLRGLLSFFT